VIHWDKDKEIIQRSWTKVVIEDNIPLWAQNVHPKRVWCKEQSSKGKFYHYYHTWWFERPEDAALFVLNWS
jgi:hypothetical protein